MPETVTADRKGATPKREPAPRARKVTALDQWFMGIVVTAIFVTTALEIAFFAIPVVPAAP